MSSANLDHAISGIIITPQDIKPNVRQAPSTVSSQNHLNVVGNPLNVNVPAGNPVVAQDANRISQQTRTKRLFMTKTFALLLYSYIIKLLFCLLNQFSVSYYQYQYKYWWVSLVFLAILLTIILFDTISQDKCLSSFPSNFIFLNIYTYFFSYIVSCAASLHTHEYGGTLVIQIIAAFCVVVVGLAVFSCFRMIQYNLRIAIPIVAVLCSAFFVASYRLQWNDWKYSLYASVSGLVLGLIVTVDMGIILDEKRSKAISYENYIGAAAIIYTEIPRLIAMIAAIVVIAAGASD